MTSEEDHQPVVQSQALQTLASLSLSSTKADRYFQAQPKQSAQLPTVKPAFQGAKGFLAGCIAACGAVTLTNPFDVVRTRLELQARAGSCGLQSYYCWEVVLRLPL